MLLQFYNITSRDSYVFNNTNPGERDLATTAPIWLLLTLAVTFLSRLPKAEPKLDFFFFFFPEMQINIASPPWTYISHFKLPDDLKWNYGHVSGFLKQFFFCQQPVNNADFIIPVEIDGTVHQVTVTSSPDVTLPTQSQRPRDLWRPKL